MHTAVNKHVNGIICSLPGPWKNHISHHPIHLDTLDCFLFLLCHICLQLVGHATVSLVTLFSTLDASLHAAQAHFVGHEKKNSRVFHIWNNTSYLCHVTVKENCPQSGQTAYLPPIFLYFYKKVKMLTSSLSFNPTILKWPLGTPPSSMPWLLY